MKFIVEGKKAYYRPYSLLTFVDGEKRYVYFNTYEEAEKYSNEMCEVNFDNKFEIKKGA